MAMLRIGCRTALAWTLGVCATLSTPAIAGGPVDEPVYRSVIVSGADMTQNADEAYTGAYYAFNGDLSREGFILRLFGTRGFYDYGNNTNDGNYWQGDLMVGYQWIRGRVDVGVYVGVDYIDYDLAIPDPSNQLQGSETGFKVALDIESNDRSNSPLYVALNGSYSTAFDTYYALARVGRTFGRFTIGPEAWALGDVTGDAQRLGAFVSLEIPMGYTTGTLTLSAGHQFGDEVVTSKGFDDGMYGTVNFRMPIGGR
jgi:hypothetical protein